MKVESHRFGTLEIAEDEIIRFPHGIIGFPTDVEFVLLRKNGQSALGWLQSLMTPQLAFPVVTIDALAVDPSYYEARIQIGADSSDLAKIAEAHAIMAIVCASASLPPTVNLLAPVIVELSTRTGAQVFLNDTKCSTAEPFALREPKAPAAMACACAAP